MKYSGIGGQAVLEGVMMRNGDRYAVTCRTEKGELVTREHKIEKEISRPFKKIPLVRGFLAFIDSLIMGIKVLNESSDIYLQDMEEEEDSSISSTLITVISMIFGLALAFGLFTVLPSFLASLFPGISHHYTLRAVLEGAGRLIVFIGYLWLISRMKDIRRVFEYHGAEHKSINCIEADMPLDVEHVRTCPTAHKRCGTSFLFFVVIVSIIVGLFIRIDTLWLRILIRLLLLPLVSGISYEILRLAGRSDSKLMKALSAPGMLCQRLTVSEPDDSMIECAIASVNAVFDWKKWQKENFPEYEDQ